MAGKRKRGDATPLEAAAQSPTPLIDKPISAIAAARLKLEAKLQAQQPSAAQETPTSPIVEATSDYGDSEFEEDTPTATLIPKNLKLCTWRKISANILSDTSEELTIVLEKHQTVSFIGCFNVNVLKGAININGANIGAAPKNSEQKKSWRVYAPSTHPITKVRGLDRVNHVQFVSCKEPAPLQEVNPLFAGIWATRKEQGRNFDFIPESDADPFKRPLVPENAPEDWLRAIEDVSSSSSASTVIIGAPMTGKSTFAKRLLNRYLTGVGKTAKAVPVVCYLDLDARNPEYTTHGQISLTVVRQINLGPSFTHPATTVRGVDEMNKTIAAFPLPIRDLANYENYFASCAKSLFQAYQGFSLGDNRPPLIINTPTTLYTTHLPLLISFLITLKPNNIIHLGNTFSIDSDAAEKLHTLTLLSTTKTNSQLYELSAQAQILPPQRTEEELRSMHIQSYFHLSSLKGVEMGGMKWNEKPIDTIMPWELCYEETETRSQDFIGFLPLFEPISSFQLATALNGSIIQIAQISDAEVLSQATDLPRTPKYHIPYFPTDNETHFIAPLDPSASCIVCTALLSSFDPENRVANIVVPKTHEALLRTLKPENTVMVAGCCETPEWAYVESVYHQQAEVKTEVELGPWTEKSSVVDGMGHLSVVRRVRKFLG
ncbi:hypothetical protein P280DRAFT_468985 [Massarina eburnea CBS 473.64]|uniref:Polynucleotide 5'-hydroxyl-kinase GRC3 n=1 Tax=Massarina eburnea CBS 473.64 TaxID=1395130 RepID=A0A6A6S5C6_9PLEO|nr:hypothetical protein P280DRAFT_468985 [Massarina eburnea CBS 473.64]